MLAAIQGGATLKKVEAAPAAAPASLEGRDGLMAAINQGGFKLKSAAERKLPEKEVPAAADSGTNDIAAALAARLKERNAKMNQDSDEDSDDWESD